MDSGAVSRLFAQMARLEEGEAMRQQPLVDLAIQQLLRCLREGADSPQNQNLLALACAAQAYYQYALVKCAAAPQGSFSANGVSVSRGDGGAEAERARAMRDEFWGMARHLLCDGGEFLFCRMEE